jgi:hypothetical protein
MISGTECNISWRRDNISTLIKYRSPIIGPEIRYVSVLNLFFASLTGTETEGEQLYFHVW